MHYIPWHYKQWHHEYRVQRLSRSTRLIFYDLLVVLWERDGQIQDDPGEISYYLRVATSEWEAAKQELLAAKLIDYMQGGKMITNHLLLNEWQRVADQYERLRGQRSAAAKKRWGKTSQNQ